jgi:hypothetical protein
MLDISVLVVKEYTKVLELMFKKIIIILILISLPFIFMARSKQKANDAQIPNAQVLKHTLHGQHSKLIK